MKKGLLLLAAVTVSSLAWAADKKVITGDPILTARNVSYHFGSAIPVYTQHHWATIVYLDKAEKIIDVLMADKDNFEIHVEKNVNFVTVNTKAESAPDARTNLSLVTVSGNIYTVAIYDVSGKPDGHADSQVNLDVSADQEMKAAMNAPPKFVPAEQLTEVNAALKAAQENLAAAKKQMEEKIATQADVAHAEAIKQVRSGYSFNKAKSDPFDVYSMTEDGKFTIVKTRAREQFAVYQVKDGKPIAINLFPDGDGTIRLDRIVDSGYFQIGKKKAPFVRTEE
jgi:conjugative transfer protein CagX